MATLARADQEYILNWVERVASTNIELAYRLSCQGKRVLDETDRSVIEAWALLVMDTYDRSGLRKAIEVMESLDNFVAVNHARVNGQALEACESVLMGFVCGLSGRRLQIQHGESVYTDTETLFLPELQSGLQNTQDNFLHYKIQTTLLWAQTRFGSFRKPIVDALLARDDEKFTALFHLFETCRLEACIARELPGLFRELLRIKGELGYTQEAAYWPQVEPLLSEPSATAALSLELADTYFDRDIPLQTAWLDALQLEQIDDCMRRRMAREKALLRLSLKKISDEQVQENPGDDDAPAFQARLDPDADERDELDVEIMVGDQPVPLPDTALAAVRSIMLDLGNIPDDYLEPAGAGEYDPALFVEEEDGADDVWSGTYHEQGATLYPEWDFRRQHYRKNWCAAREKSVAPVYDNFVPKTLNKYRGLVKHLRKTFEAMRDVDRLLKRQPDGDGIDIDALVEALADAHEGAEMSDRLFTRMYRNERNIAVVFMVDMSGSTKGWINDAERESLVLLCESLQTLGDRYAIYGFSSVTRKRCEIYHIKHFHEHYSDEVQARISGIEPQDYTRMGFAIRHLTHLLKQVDARTRILITLSDGKPDDYDHYRGEFGIEDTRRALIEARRDGIHPYCITIDETARDYLPRLYGPAAYTVVKEVRDLPVKVSDIYRRLTT